MPLDYVITLEGGSYYVGETSSRVEFSSSPGDAATFESEQAAESVADYLRDLLGQTPAKLCVSRLL